MPTAAAVSLVRRAVRAALARERAIPDAWHLRDGVPVPELLEAVIDHRVATLLAGIADRFPNDVAATLRTLDKRDRLEAMALIRASALVDGQLAGLDHLIVKGAALGAQTTSDATARGGGDIDVVVRPGDLGAAVDVLLGEGWEARDGYTVDQASWAWRHQLRTTYELGLKGPLGHLDLHWRLDPTYGALPGFDELWSRHVTVDIGPASIATLARPDAFRHALRHAAKDRWSSLRSLVDIARLADDPRIWPDHVDRLDRATLSVVHATVGLHPAAPPFTSLATAIPTALRTQVDTADEPRFPGDRAQRFARYLLASGSMPRDLLTAASMITLPPVLTADLHDERAVPAIAAAVTRRLTHACRNVRERG